MDEKDWKEIRRLKIQYMGTSRGIALGNLIAEKQRLDQIRQIVSDYNSSTTTKVIGFDKIDRLLEQE